MDLGIELSSLPFPDQVGRRRGVDHDFLCHHPTELTGSRILAAAEGLGEHGHETSRELHTDLGLLAWREHIHHAIHRLGSRTGVQRAEHKMTGFSSADGQLDCFQVSHFADEDHIWVFPQCRTQGIGEAPGVFVELALVHQALIALVDEFDRILDGEDVFAAGVIDVIQQCSQGGGLAGTCGSRDQHQAPRTLAGLDHDRRQVQNLDAGDLAAQGPQAGGITALLPVHVHPETGDASESVGAVQFPGLFEGLALAVVQHREDQPVAVLLFQGFLQHRAQFAAETSVGRLSGGDVQIAAACFDQLHHQVFDHQIHTHLLTGVPSGSRDIRASSPEGRRHNRCTSLC